ncbi:UPF0149 family protein [Loktanella sp. Alg231-35]|uniref:UPF0149 family protein n=1 Tax=Loktanella sp. Alg231-35 TaxID=1922220 RepID=UPI00131EF852|nr:UPF0149 family protein [Loktanella sp. Alg231-35]
MTKLSRAMTDILTELDAYLCSEDSPPDSLGLSDLDGFLTGVVCTPFPVANWVDVAFGAGATVPRRIMEMVEQRLAEIEAGLSSTTPALEPVFWQAPEGHAIAMDWCEGFMEAVKLNVTTWDEFGQSEIGAKLMSPILVHMFDDDGNSMFAGAIHTCG